MWSCIAGHKKNKSQIEALRNTIKKNSYQQTNTKISNKVSNKRAAEESLSDVEVKQEPASDEETSAQTAVVNTGMVGYVIMTLFSSQWY